MNQQKKDLRDRASKAVLAMREKGLAMTEAQEKHEDGKYADAKTAFEKAKEHFAAAKLALQALEDVEAAEREMQQVVNPVRERAETTTVAPAKAEALSAARKEVFVSYLRNGEKPEFFSTLDRACERLEIGPSERHALFGIRADLGGVLVPEDFRAEVVKNLAGFAVVRMAGARVVPTTSSTLVFPSVAGGTNPYSTGVSGAWRAEGSQGTDGTAPATQDQPTFGSERIPVHVWQPNAIVITRELTADSVVNLDTLIAQLLAETKALDEDAAFLNGNGTGQPRGIFNYAEAAVGPAISVVNSGSNGAYTYNGLINLMTALPAQFRQNAVWITNSASFGAILQLKDSSQMPILYQPSLPDTFLSKKFYLSEQVPVMGTGSYSLAFGDMRFYCIAEREDLRLQRLEERFAPNVAILATARLGGGVLRTQAFVIQKLSA